MFELTGDGSPSADALLQAYRISINHTRSLGETLTAEEYMRTVVEGAQLLQTVEHTGRTVVTFDMVNPFPYVLGMRPGNGYPQFCSTGPTASQALSPTPEAMLGSADLVMVPALPDKADQLANMQRLYGAYLRRFSIVPGHRRIGSSGAPAGDALRGRRAFGRRRVKRRLPQRDVDGRDKPGYDAWTKRDGLSILKQTLRDPPL